MTISDIVIKFGFTLQVSKNQTLLRLEFARSRPLSGSTPLSGSRPLSGIIISVV